MNPKLNENLAQEYKKIFPLKNAILKCINEFNDIMQPQSINFGLKGLLSTILFGGGLLSNGFGLKKKNATLLTGGGISIITSIYMIGEIMLSEKKQEVEEKIKEEDKRKKEEKKFLGNSNFLLFKFLLWIFTTKI